MNFIKVYGGIMVYLKGVNSSVCVCVAVYALAVMGVTDMKMMMNWICGVDS